MVNMYDKSTSLEGAGDFREAFGPASGGAPASITGQSKASAAGLAVPLSA